MRPDEITCDIRNVSQVTGLSLWQLRSYDESGYVSPSVSPAQGSGKARVYSFCDVILLRIVAAMRDLRLPPGEFQNVLEHLKAQMPSLMTAKDSLLLIMDSNDLLALTDDPADLMRYASTGRSLVALPLGRLVNEVRTALMESRKARRSRYPASA